MKEQGMGRTRLGRLAAVTIPATAASLGFGYAIVQGAVTAQLSAADPFQVKADSATASGLELSLRAAETATSNTNAAAAQKKSALVTLKEGVVNNMCLAANQPTGLPGPLATIGLTVSASGAVSLGDLVDLSADAVNSSSATLPQTSIGVAQTELDHQKDIGAGINPGGFGLESVGDVAIQELDADAYALTLGGLSLANGLSIAPTLGAASCD